ncbi:MAG: hypothetical protein FWG85_00155 [Bacteroidetes bacterium]|nr:hypothetical protein [Bacteroidota bacterium]
MLNNLDLEKIESKYLEKFYHFLKFTEDEMLKGLQTKEKIKDDWYKYWNSGAGSSDFDIGAERIVYALFNGKGIGQPNSCPIGSDLFFEVDDAFIHIDLKTVQTRNVGDYNTSIFVGANQNSYNGDMIVNRTEIRKYGPHLPHYYTCGKIKKPCLTYFVTILYEDIKLDILNINLLCMPNGQLINEYRTDVLKAGKLVTQTRFNFSKTLDFRLLKNKKRVKIVYMNENKILKDDKLKKGLNLLLDVYKEQK